VCGVVIVEGEGTCYKALFDGSFAVTHKALPDLVILNEDISLDPASPHIKEEVIISVTVRNEGKADAENFWVILLIDDEVVHRVFIEVLAKDESVTITYTWIPLYSGGYIIQAIADPPEGLL
jgi:subtilase family serine protease